MDGHIEMAASAKVLQFPAGGRAGIARRALFSSVQNENRKSPQIVYDSWYHEAALADDTGKNG